MSREIFKTCIRIPIGYINYGGHLGHDSLLTLLQEARIQWLKSINNNFSELCISDSTFWVVKKVVAEYLCEGFHGDNIEITITAGLVKNTSFTLKYHAYNQTQEKMLAEAETLMVCIDRTNKKICGIPSPINKCLSP